MSNSGIPIVSDIARGVENVFKAIVNVVSSVVMAIVQPFMGLFGGPPDIPSATAEANRQQGALVQVQGGGGVSIPVVYGYRKVAGIVTYAETGDTQNKFLYVAYVFSEGPVEGLREVWLNDDLLVDSAFIQGLNAGAEMPVTLEKYAGRVTMRWSHGTYFDNPLTSSLGTNLKNGMFANAPTWDKWGDATGFANRKMYNGLATMFVRYEWKEINTPEDNKKNPFTGSLPTVQVSLLGRKVAPILSRDGSGNTNRTYTTSTNSSGITEYTVSSLSGAMTGWQNNYSGRYGNTAGSYAEVFSYNPAEILLDYLRNPRYGKGLKENEIDLNSFAIAAAKYETRVTFTDSGLVGRILDCNYIVDTAQPLMTTVKNFLQNGRAYMPYIQGKYKLKVEDAGNPILIAGPGSGVATVVAEATSDYYALGYSSANQYDIVDNITYNSIDRSNKYNQVVVTYVDPDQKWSNQQAVYPVSETDRLYYQTLDGGRENKQEVTMSAITNYSQALDMARLLFFKSRYQETCTLKVASQAFELEPGDIIRIKSRLLNFGTTPWRVIGIEYNQDCTFQLSCVRNEEAIYPYVPVGEPDIVNPLYIPKGIVSVYPKEIIRIGYNPPGHAFYPPGWSGTVPNPGPTPTPVIPAPPVAPIEPPKDNIVDVSKVEYVDKNGLTYARLTITQPDNAMYYGVDIYWKLVEGTDTYQILRDTTVPGVRKTFTIDLGPLATVASLAAVSNNYQLILRVRYTTQELSSKFTKLVLNPATKALSGQNPSEVGEVVESAWPKITFINQNARDNRIDLMRGFIQSTAGNPRVLSFALAQDVRTQDINYNIAGVNIYYKAETENYWYVHKAKFGAYAPGQFTNFDFVGDVGNYGTGASPSYYNFVFRLTYKDGGESLYQTSYRLNLRIVEESIVGRSGYGTPASEIFSSEGNAGGLNTGSNILNTAFPLQTYDQAPPGSVVDKRDMQIGIMHIGNSGSSSADAAKSLTKFVLWAPPAAEQAQLRGFKIRYRPVAPGQDPVLISVDAKPVQSQWNDQSFPGYVATPNGIFVFDISGMVWGTRYEVVITPIVSYAGARVEGNVSLYGSGYVTNDSGDALFPKNPTAEPFLNRSNVFGTNWVSVYGFQQLNTNVALNKADQPFSAINPTIDVRSCVAYKKPWDENFAAGKITKLQDGIVLTLNADKITDFRGVTVYRRHFKNNPGVTGTGNPDASYYGVGRWEKVQFWRGGDNGAVASGDFSVGLKLPSDYREFSQYFGTGRTASPAYTLTEGFGKRDGYPDNLVLICNSTQLAEIQLLVVVNYGSASSPTESGKGILIQGQPMDLAIGTCNFLQNSLGGIKPRTVEMQYEPNIRDSDFPNIAGSSSLRKLSDARVISVKNNSGQPGATPTTQAINLGLTCYYPSDYPTQSYFAYAAYSAGATEVPVGRPAPRNWTLRYQYYFVTDGSTGSVGINARGYDDPQR